MEFTSRKRKKQRIATVDSCPNDPGRLRVTKPPGVSECCPSSLSDVDHQVDVIDLKDKGINARQFYQKYIALRKPCIIENWIVSENSTAKSKSPKHCSDQGEDLFLHVPAPAILKALLQTDTMVQVERRPSISDRFGHVRSPQRQCWMTMSAFLQEICGLQEKEAAGDAINSTAKIKSDDDDATHPLEESSSFYYLSTQENTAPPVDAEDTYPPESFFGPPCDRLRALDIIPSHVSLAGNLRLSSCNLWMGRCGSNATHSGLHHDYHDNFYLLMLGEKEFILYPPHDAYHVAMSGEVERIHPNGLISYQNASIQSDGRPRNEITTIPDNGASDGDSSEANSDADKAERSAAVIGKGFDYESSGSDDEIGEVWSDDADQDAFDNDENDDDDVIGDQQQDETEAMLPNNFSWIDPVSMDPNKIVETFPSYASATPIQVHLQAKQCLYLPASWLHCVISKGRCKVTDNTSEKPHGSTKTNAEGLDIPSSVHMAINYWYHPPNCLESFEHPYDDREYWEKTK
jgi:Cupin-like domain